MMSVLLLNYIPHRIPGKTFCIAIPPGAEWAGREMLSSLFGGTLGIRSVFLPGDWSSSPSNLPHVCFRATLDEGTLHPTVAQRVGTSLATVASFPFQFVHNTSIRS